MAKVVLVFEDIGTEGDAKISYEGEPDFDIEGDVNKFTSAQVMAMKCLEYITELANEDPEEEIKNLPPMCERH